MRRPFSRFRPVGPFAQPSDDSPLTIESIREQVGTRDYDPTGWCSTRPKRLYHNTDVTGLARIAKEGKMKNPDDRFNEVFATAAPMEKFGGFTILFDGDELVESGFSPRTYLFATDGNEDRDIIDTAKGSVITAGNLGCIPQCLWDNYKYLNQSIRCGTIEHAYQTNVEPSDVEPFGSFDIDGPNPEFNLGMRMQQTFSLVKDGGFNIPTPEFIIYEDTKVHDDFHNREPAKEVANVLNTKAITLDKAADMFPEILSPESAYNVY